MRRLAAALRLETVLQARYQFYAVTAVVALVWVAVLRLLPPGLRAQPAMLAPAFVVMNLQVTAFYFVTALVLLEKGQGAVQALVVSPLRPREYLAAKALSLAALAAAENAVVVALVFGPDAGWGWFGLGALAGGVIYALVGVVAVAPYDAINRFLMPSMAYIVFLSVPLLGYYGVVPWWTMAWHPVMPPLVLLRAAWDAVPAAMLAYGIAGSAAWVALSGLWARRAFERSIASVAA